MHAFDSKPLLCLARLIDPRKVAALGDVTGVRAGVPRHSVGNFLSASASGAGITARPLTVGVAPVRERGVAGDVAVTAGPVAGASLQGGVLW